MRRRNSWTRNSVIIEPYWNWNLLLVFNAFGMFRYNWTLLELKLLKPVGWKGKARSYNWTLLELKQKCSTAISTDRLVIIEPYWNWNWISFWDGLWRRRVIIEPYWNWNKIEITGILLTRCYNWTLLELKRWRNCDINFFVLGYNWTLLELKQSCQHGTWRAQVIIEPYWNWNRYGWSSLHPT